jgi:hypothetical protein
MLTRSTYHQPTLTQMEFVKKPAPKGRPIPSGWQRTVDPATGDHFYVSASSGRVVYKFDDMFKKVYKKTVVSKAVTPIPAPQSVISVFEESVPDRAVSSHVYSTPPRRFKDGTLSQPIQLEEEEDELSDELSEALSDLTNTQLPPKRNHQKRRKRVFEAVDESQGTQGAVLGEEHWETDNDTVRSPNLLVD